MLGIDQSSGDWLLVTSNWLAVTRDWVWQFIHHPLITLRQSVTPEAWICLAGLILLACWLLRTSLGTRALADSRPRRNDMPIYLPMIPLLLWFGPVPMVAIIARQVVGMFCPTGQTSLTGQGFAAFLDNCVFVAGGVVITAVILLLARVHFARRLKGFGLDIRTVPADFFCAFVNLLAVWPLIIAAIAVTTFLGQRIWGQDYQLQPHQELELITEYPQLMLRIAIVVVAVVMAPLLEELLFRGLVQTMIRSLIGDWLSVTGKWERRVATHSPVTIHQSPVAAWLAIAVSSGLFTLMHANPGHWPALFILGACMGYAYEKSGSLFRPIFVHCLFNAVMIAATLSQS